VFRGGKEMNILKQFDEVLEYIEQNLLKEIKSEEIAKVAGCSWYAFQRMFSYIVGIPLSEYIRNRKMSNAGFELFESDNKVIDIALKYGYSSSNSFNRAFQSVHGFPPSKAKEKRKELVVYPRIRLNISVSGDKSIKYRIEEKDEMIFLGKNYLLSEDIESNFQNTPLFWDDFVANNYLDKMLSQKECLDDYVYGIATYHEDKTNQYFIALRCDKRANDNIYQQVIIPSQTWLILSNSGEMPEAMIQMYRKFYNEWLPVSDYEYDFNADIEVYPMYSSNTCEYELWLPIKRKEFNNE